MPCGMSNSSDIEFSAKYSLILAVDTRSSRINEEHSVTMQDNIKQ